jgi:hypothetical protein
MIIVAVKLFSILMNLGKIVLQVALEAAIVLTKLSSQYPVHSRTQSPSYARRGAVAKSITGYHENMVSKQYPVLELANQMPVRIWIWPEPLVAPRVKRALGTRMYSSFLYQF